jgi:hypothetical protein
MLVKLNDGVPAEWPVTAARLRYENPKISFPASLAGIDLSEYGFAPFQCTDPDVYNPKYETLEEVVPRLVDGVYVQTWSISDIYTTEERQALDAEEAAQLPLLRAEEHRGTRSELLMLSDWTQIADATVNKVEWATYRQALRDITTHSNWPDLTEADWPTAP